VKVLNPPGSGKDTAEAKGVHREVESEERIWQNPGLLRIAENNDIITDFWTDNLMELILRKENLNKAYKKVKSNNGAGGIDGMQVDDLLPYLRENQDELIQQIRWGKYKPNPVRKVEIPKEKKTRLENWEYRQ
jgi:retron-type reverse transcriptase